MIRSFEQQVNAVAQDIKRYPTYGASGAFNNRSGVFHADCPTAFGHLSDGDYGTVWVLLTRMAVSSLDGTPRANFLGMDIKGKLHNNICLSDQMNVRGDPPVAAGCYDPTKPLAGRAVVQGDLAVVVGVGVDQPPGRDAVQECRLLESTAQAVVDAVARMS